MSVPSVAVDRRRFLLSAVPTVLGAGVGVAVAPRPTPAAAAVPVATNARRGVGLGTQRVLWSIDSETDVALTFDDGPDPDLTPGLLDVLREHDVVATFMLIGAFAARHPDLVARIRDGGHEVGNHTWSHPGLDSLPPAAVREELHRAAEVLGEVRLFRPPRGLVSGVAVQAAAELGYDVLLWSTEAGEAFQPCDICVMHDGLGRAGFDPRSTKAATMRGKRRRELAALPAALRDALGRGVRFVPVPGDTATTPA